MTVSIHKANADRIKKGMSKTRDGRVTSYTITTGREGPLVIFISPQDQQLKEKPYKITHKMKGLYCEEDS